MLAKWRGSKNEQAASTAIVAANGPPAPVSPAAPGAPPPEPIKAKKSKTGKIEEKPEETPHQKRERIKKENLAECCNICIFFIFLAIFTVAVLLDQSASSSRLADHIRSRMDQPVRLSSVTSGATLQTYLEQTLIQALYENSSDTQMASMMSSSLHPIDVSNRLLGSPRLRQVRVDQASDCQVSPMFSDYKITCYPPVNSGDDESQTAFGPDNRYVWARDSHDIAYTGYLGSYSPNGFTVELSTNGTHAMNTLQRLDADNFMDQATRAIFVDFTVWNENVGTYAVVRLAVELGASGGVKKHLDVLTMTEASLKPGGFGNGTDWVSFFLFIIVMIFVVFKFIVEEIQEIARQGLSYLMDGWNIMDWLNMILLIVAFVMRMLIYLTASSNNGVGSEQMGNKEAVSTWHLHLADQIKTVRLLFAFNSILLWLKVVKYLRHMPYLKTLIRTVWSALDLFMPFLLMFVVVFIGFAWSYNIGFGDQILELATFGNTCIYLCRAFLRDVRLMPAYEITPAFGATLILLFYVALVLVGLSVLFAIIADSLFRAKYDAPVKTEEELHLHEEEPLEDFYREWHHRIKKCMKKRTPWLYGMIFGKKRHVHAHRTAHGIQFTEDHPPGADPALALTSGSKLTSNDSNNMTGPRAITGGWRMGSKQSALAIADAGADSDSSSSVGTSDIPRPDQPSEAQLKSAIEHMSGRILSEVSIVGIEIKSELHDVCERVAQMQMAVEELTWRGEKIRVEQLSELG